MTEPVLHDECPQCGSCWGCWEQTVTTLRELLFSVTEDRDRLRDKYEQLSHDPLPAPTRTVETEGETG